MVWAWINIYLPDATGAVADSDSADPWNLPNNCLLAGPSSGLGSNQPVFPAIGLLYPRTSVEKRIFFS